MAIIGNTVRVTLEFRKFDGELASPDTVVFGVYDGERSKIYEESLSPISAGVYKYDYVVPEEGVGPLVVEVEGVLEGMPIVQRKRLPRVWV